MATAVPATPAWVWWQQLSQQLSLPGCGGNSCPSLGVVATAVPAWVWWQQLSQPGCGGNSCPSLGVVVTGNRRPCLGMVATAVLALALWIAAIVCMALDVATLSPTAVLVFTVAVIWCSIRGAGSQHVGVASANLGRWCVTVLWMCVKQQPMLQCCYGKPMCCSVFVSTLQPTVLRMYALIQQPPICCSIGVYVLNQQPRICCSIGMYAFNQQSSICCSVNVGAEASQSGLKPMWGFWGFFVTAVAIIMSSKCSLYKLLFILHHMFLWLIKCT